MLPMNIDSFFYEIQCFLKEIRYKTIFLVHLFTFQYSYSYCEHRYTHPIWLLNIHKTNGISFSFYFWLFFISFYCVYSSHWLSYRIFKQNHIETRAREKSKKERNTFSTQHLRKTIKRITWIYILVVWVCARIINEIYIALNMCSYSRLANGPVRQWDIVCLQNLWVKFMYKIA